MVQQLQEKKIPIKKIRCVLIAVRLFSSLSLCALFHFRVTVNSCLSALCAALCFCLSQSLSYFIPSVFLAPRTVLRFLMTAGIRLGGRTSC